jgi:hypothetical protein
VSRSTSRCGSRSSAPRAPTDSSATSRIELELVDVSGPLIDAIEQLLSAPDPPPLPTRADILAQLKDTIDRSVPFAVSGGGALQRIETRTFAGDPAVPSAIGVYIDLALRNGPRLPIS